MPMIKNGWTAAIQLANIAWMYGFDVNVHEGSTWQTITFKKHNKTLLQIDRIPQPPRRGTGNLGMFQGHARWKMDGEGCHTTRSVAERLASLEEWHKFIDELSDDELLSGEL